MIKAALEGPYTRAFGRFDTRRRCRRSRSALARRTASPAGPSATASITPRRFTFSVPDARRIKCFRGERLIGYRRCRSPHPGRPDVAARAAKAASSAGVSQTSSGTASASCKPAARPVRRAASRALSTRRAPRSDRARASAAPMPVEAPMSQTRRSRQSPIAGLSIASSLRQPPRRVKESVTSPEFEAELAS